MSKIELMCKECGKKIYAKPSDIKRGRKYCSQKCYHKQLVWNKDKPRSEETKRKISETRKKSF